MSQSEPMTERNCSTSRRSVPASEKLKAEITPTSEGGAPSSSPVAAKVGRIIDAEGT
jgi:hypothetical protein